MTLLPRRLRVIVLLLMLPVLARAQAGSNSAILLELPASTRALAMGNAFAAAGTDEAAIFYNPAQLAVVHQLSVGLSVQRYFASSSIGALAMATRVGPGTFGIGLQVIDFGSIDEVVPDPAFGGERGMPTGATLSAHDFAGSVAYAVALRRLRVGATAKFVGEYLAGESGSTGAVDIGASFVLWHAATIAASVQNLGGTIHLARSRAPLPRLTRLAAAVPVTGLGPFDVTATAALVHTRGGATEPRGGVEVAWHTVDGFTVLGRAGALGQDNADVSPVSFGGGIRARHLALDYAYEGFDTFGGTHRIGIRWWR